MTTSIKNKTVFTFINIICLFVTLAFPNSSTPLSVIPVIVSVSYWVYSTGHNAKVQNDRRIMVATYIFLVIALILATVCCIIGFTHEINAVNSDNLTDSNLSVDAQMEVTAENKKKSENGLQDNDLTATTTKYVITPKADYGISISMPSNYNSFAYLVVILAFSLSVGDIICEWLYPESDNVVLQSIQVEEGKSEFEKEFEKQKAMR